MNKARNRKIALLSYFDNQCTLCGYNKALSSLHFHHIDPKTKEFEISKKLMGNWEELLEEVKKCIVVCSNCHCELHEGILDINDFEYLTFNGLI